jgi:hypothetical protein
MLTLSLIKAVQDLLQQQTEEASDNKGYPPQFFIEARRRAQRGGELCLCLAFLHTFSNILQNGVRMI